MSTWFQWVFVKPHYQYFGLFPEGPGNSIWLSQQPNGRSKLELDSSHFSRIWNRCDISRRSIFEVRPSSCPNHPTACGSRLAWSSPETRSNRFHCSNNQQIGKDMCFGYMSPFQLTRLDPLMELIIQSPIDSPIIR